MSDTPAEEQELPWTWEQAIALGMFDGPTIQMIAQFFGGIPDRKITKADYERLRKRIGGRVVSDE